MATDDAGESLRDLLMRRLNVQGAQAWARDLQAPGGLARYVAPQGASVPRAAGDAVGPTSEIAPTAPTTQTAENAPEAAPTPRDLQGPNPLGDRMTALLQSWQPTNPAHEPMRQQLLGGDPGALRGFQAALAEGGPDATSLQARLADGGGQTPSLMAASKASLPILPATTSIRELRGNQEGLSTATTVPQGGPGGGPWINPGYPGWEEKNILPVGGGQYRDFNFGGYGDPIRQQQAEDFKRIEMLKWMGPSAATHYLMAQMQVPLKTRELDIEAQKVGGEAPLRRAQTEHFQAETRKLGAEAEELPANVGVRRFQLLQGTNMTGDPRQTIANKKASNLPLTFAEKMLDKGYTDEPYEELIKDKDLTPEELVQHPNPEVAAEALAVLKAQQRGLTLAPSGSQAGFGGPRTTREALEKATGEAQLKKMQEAQRAQPPTALDRLILQLFGGKR